MLELDKVSLSLDGEVFLNDINLTLKRGELNILLGPTLAGKTTLMRVMAGLDKPDRGSIRFDGESVLGVPVQERNIAMVYQQFINYPTLSVYENIASPLKVAGLDKVEIDSRVDQVAGLLRLEEFLDRKPNTLSGGQQQRLALARALVKEAELVILDEPLANLDYKLREELRSELPKLFAESGAVLVYATTEPSEALVLGGNTACMQQGRIEQFGPTLDLYRHPEALQSARTFSDPPLNTVTLSKGKEGLTISGTSQVINLPQQQLIAGKYTMGVRPHHLSLEKCSGIDIEVNGVVTVMEMSGSESFIHFNFNGNDWVALVHGIQNYYSGELVSFYIQPSNIFLFDALDRVRNHNSVEATK